LYWQGEGITPTENKKITMWKSDEVDTTTLFSRLEQLERAIEANNVHAVLEHLGEMVPEAKLNGIGAMQAVTSKRPQRSTLKPVTESSRPRETYLKSKIVGVSA
jgi:hypothetical protein